MAKRVHEIEDSREAIARLGIRLRVVAALLFGASVLCAVALVGAAALGVVASLDSAGVFGIAAPLVWCAICAGMAWALGGMAKDMAAGASPFTFGNARRIKAVGWLFVAGVAIELLFSPGFAAITVGMVEFVSQPAAAVDFPVLPVDIASIIGAIVSFSLASVWRYGALMQAQMDDLV
ncbi:MAG: hypothetical protein Q4B69_08040 [Slackia sp.]|nr:hypothetical protein [Slackia sp.]